MVTEHEIKSRKFKNSFEREKVSYQVTAGEMSEFKMNRKKLAHRINGYVLKLQTEKNISRNQAAEIIYDRCQQSWDIYKKIFSGKIRPTREFLYKFCIGMNLSREETDELFALSEGGCLTDDNIGDYIFVRALGKDSIFSFIEEYEKYVEKKIGLRNP